MTKIWTHTSQSEAIKLQMLGTSGYHQNLFSLLLPYCNLHIKLMIMECFVEELYLLNKPSKAPKEELHNRGVTDKLKLQNGRHERNDKQRMTSLVIDKIDISLIPWPQIFIIICHEFIVKI